MPITKNGQNVIVETPIKDDDLFKRTGVIEAPSFAICDQFDKVKQIQFDPSLQATNSKVTLRSGATSGNIILDLPATSGTLSSGAAFTIIQPDSGTSPVATGATDTLTLTSTELTISGNSGTDTITFSLLAPTASAISASGIDWSLLLKRGGVYTKTLSANTTFTFSNVAAGTIIVRLTNTASNYTVTWPGTVKWSGNTAPTQTVGAKSDIYTFVSDGTTTFGSVVQNFG